MTVEELSVILEANKEKPEFIALIGKYAPKPELTAEIVTPWLETAEGQRVLQPITDARITQAIKTHDEKQAPKIKEQVDKMLVAELAKMAPKEETPEQKQIRELNLKFEQSEKARQNEILKSRLSAEALKMKVDAHAYLLEDFLPETFEDGVVKLQKIKKHEDELVTAAIHEFVAKNGGKPGSGNGKDGKGPMTFKQYAALPQAERIRMQETGEASKLVPD